MANEEKVGAIKILYFPSLTYSKGCGASSNWLSRVKCFVCDIKVLKAFVGYTYEHRKATSTF